MCNFYFSNNAYAALDANLKNSDETLAGKLITAGVFTEYQFNSCYDASALENAYDSYNTWDSVAYDEPQNNTWQESTAEDHGSYENITIANNDSSMTPELIKQLEGIAVFWAPTGDKVHLEINVRFHDLRHYYASLMLSLGVPDKYAMKRMGHNTNHMLKNVYQHLIDEKNVEITEQINAYFDSMQHGMQHGEPKK